MLRIALASPYDYAYPGGVNEHIRYLARHLRERGHQVDILAPSSDEEGSQEEGMVRVDAGIIPIPFGGSIARVTLSPLVFGAVKRILRRRRYDIVHVHEPTVPAISLAVLHHSHATNIGTFHQYSDRNTGYLVAGPIARYFIGRLHGRIAVSQAARDFVSHYFPGDYRVIPNGIEVVDFRDPALQPFPEYLNDGKLNILFLGRFEKRKGFRYLLRAFRQVKEAMPEARLLVVGAYEPEDRRSYLRYVRYYNLRDVKFIGKVSHADKVRWFKTAHVYCAPSTGGESFGIVLTEAMAAGAPIVATDIPGYRSVIDDGVTGILVPPGDEGALTVALIGLLRDPERRARLRDAASHRVLRYDWTRVTQEVESFYYETMERNRRVAHYRTLRPGVQAD
jgi:phosphatidylinositol alpha-mannosyltransferase